MGEDAGVPEILIKVQVYDWEEEGAVVSWGKTETIQKIPAA